ncbi:hypothetical protein ACOTVS_10470 [Aliarcobacter butzleri]|uniref:hypothetical protein n=1 Tax=Aliarcobacter butzleri TaxID=28197 RepID=UPI00344E4101
MKKAKVIYFTINKNGKIKVRQAKVKSHDEKKIKKLLSKEKFVQPDEKFFMIFDLIKL